MPELQFKGKEFVYNHHLTVPFRPLEMHAAKGIGDARLEEEAFDFRAAVILFGELDAKLPALIAEAKK